MWPQPALPTKQPPPSSAHPSSIPSIYAENRRQRHSRHQQQTLPRPPAKPRSCGALTHLANICVWVSLSGEDCRKLKLPKFIWVWVMGLMGSRIYLSQHQALPCPRKTFLISPTLHTAATKRPKRQVRKCKSSPGSAAWAVGEPAGPAGLAEHPSLEMSPFLL